MSPTTGVLPVHATTTTANHESSHPRTRRSHFIFADDGSGDLADRHELKLRNKLERYICEGSAYQSHGRTPRVLLVVNGHEHTLRVVLESLSRPQPVLVLADTGGAAGDIANYVASGVLPKTGPTTKYPRLARAMLPEIARMGRACGGNGQPLLVLVEAGELALQSDAGGLEVCAALTKTPHHARCFAGINPGDGALVWGGELHGAQLCTVLTTRLPTALSDDHSLVVAQRRADRGR